MKNFPKITEAAKSVIKNFEESGLIEYDSYFKPSLFSIDGVANSTYFGSELDDFNVKHKLALKFKAEAKELTDAIFEEFSKLKSSKNSHRSKDLSVEKGQEYFTPSLYVGDVNEFEVTSHIWQDYEFDNELYKAGLTFETKELALKATEELFGLLSKIK